LAFVFGYELRRAADEGAAIDVDDGDEDVFVDFGKENAWVC
jgi:hypothetical protein